MRIGILGTGAVAAALGARWAHHDLTIAGRSPANTRALADRLGATAATFREAVTNADVVLLAVRWEGVPDVLAAAGDALRGKALIDPTNAVENGIGVLLPSTSAAESVAERSGAHVVKAFHLFPAAHWADATGTVVPLCGDDQAALTAVAGLVRDTGATPAVLGPLSRARQLEEVAGFVIGLAFAGVNPNSAVPST
ncbi:NADPH-dependent F420 reductase [Actinokineospora globicatena]|uniref:NADP oxidoreductase n=1 Tax=Actinokineospora globicatena TaxID=103729 RepID=A0A9W6QUQ8_9PSEU|nr:NAD(P)-binding domain-containing protein [Actinokineospora globicatena]GLW95200.1 NADP oxidoreductase [Actinokineospora globicatena]